MKKLVLCVTIFSNIAFENTIIIFAYNVLFLLFSENNKMQCKDDASQNEDIRIHAKICKEIL